MSSNLFKLTEVEGRSGRNSRVVSLSFITEIEQRIASVYISDLTKYGSRFHPPCHCRQYVTGPAIAKTADASSIPIGVRRMSSIVEKFCKSKRTVERVGSSSEIGRAATKNIASAPGPATSA